MRAAKRIVLAAFAVLWGGAAWAQSDNPARTEQEPPGEVRATVLKVDGKTLYLDQRGVVVPVRVDATTQFEGSRTRLRDYRAGDRVRVAVKVEDGTRNVARRIAIDDTSRPGVGGSGVTPPAVEPTHPPSPLDPGSGTGGSGVMNYGAEKNAPGVTPALPAPEASPPSEP